MSFSSIGVLRYSRVGDDFKIHVDVDPGIAAYYRWMMERKPRLTRYPPHISVLRKETPAALEYWGRHDGAQIEFSYGHYIYDNGVYVWLQAYSKRLEEIRLELGLGPLSELARPPDLADCFHITIGNWK